MFGHTLYASDYWLARLAWHGGKFPVDKEHIPDATERARVTALLEKFNLRGGLQSGYNNRVMLRPGTVYGSWNKTPKGDLVCDIHRIDMQVDGSDVGEKIDPASGKIKEDRSLHRGDVRFETARFASLMTRHYDEIAEMFPLFERSRQLTGLLTTLTTLKEKHGFKPGAQLAAHIDEAYNFYANLPALTVLDRAYIFTRTGGLTL